MNTKYLIKYISSLCGLQLDEVTLFKLAEKTSNFDLAEFANFVENNLDNVHLKYKNPIGKFITFCKLFEKEIRLQKQQEVKNDVQKLVDKFSKIKIVLQNELLQGRKPQLDEIKEVKTKQNYFTNFEISILRKIGIGDVKYLISLANSHQLENSISNSLLISLMPPVQNTALSFSKQQIKIKRF